MLRDPSAEKAFGVFLSRFMGIYGSFPVFCTLPTAFLTGTAAAAGIALINSQGNLAGYFAPQVVAWLTQGGGDYGRALFALGLSMLTPAVVARALRSKRLPVVSQHEQHTLEA